MKQEQNHFALRDGKIVYVQDVPEKPRYIDIRNGAFASIAGGNLSMKDRYEQALQYAIYNGIEVYNDGDVESTLWKSLPLKKDTLYALQCRVEKINYCASDVCDTDGECEHCREPKTLARVTFDEQPEKKCKACIIEENDEQVKQMPEHTCSKGPKQEEKETVKAWNKRDREATGLQKQLEGLKKDINKEIELKKEAFADRDDVLSEKINIQKQLEELREENERLNIRLKNMEEAAKTETSKSWDRGYDTGANKFDI